MMKAFIVEIKKILTSSGFWFCVCGTVIMLFSAEVWTDHSTMNRYSVFKLIADVDRETYLQYSELCRSSVMSSARSGWFTLFVPTITAFCFVPHICAERETNAVRFEVFRGTNFGFSLSRLLSGIISAGAAVAAGYLTFCAIVSVIFPAESEYMWDIMAFSVPKAALGVFIYSVFWSAPAMSLTAVMRNKHLIICIPFFIKYALTQTDQKLLSDAYGNFEAPDIKLGEFAVAASPEALMFNENNALYFRSALIFGGMFLLMSAGYLIIQTKRSDKGA